jgi:hypothetical protein
MKTSNKRQKVAFATPGEFVLAAVNSGEAGVTAAAREAAKAFPLVGNAEFIADLERAGVNKFTARTQFARVHYAGKKH